MKFLIQVICLSLAMTSLPTFATIDSLSQAINESGRLRMLSQRMAKAYLLTAMDIQPNKAQAQFNGSINKFESNLVDLTLFTRDMNNASIEISLAVIQREWTDYKNILQSPLSISAASRILASSDKTLAACEELVQQLEKSAQRQSARWVNLSGRQRMLSQRIAKFYSALSWGGANNHYDEGLQTAINEFDIALKQLIESPDNTHFVNHKLRKVETQWLFSKQGFKQLTKGASTPLVISMTTETILRQMNDITALYEEIDNNKKAITTI
jgi:nitrate/nitrite-specific signal transduction histidine kinase